MLSENTSIIGKPEISFTENNDPLKLSVIENNSPWEPCTVNTGWVEPDPYTTSDELTEVFPSPLILALPVTLKDPVILADPVNGKVGANDALNEFKAYDAVPCNDPVKFVDVTFVKPANVVDVAPKLIAVDPIVIALFVNCEFAIFVICDDPDTVPAGK